MKKTILIAALALMATAAQAREVISVVGSSTVYPFTTVVAEQFGKTTSFKTPKIESTGTGGGMKLFCGGVGVEYPDATNASRAIKKSEVEQCASNGVTDILEIKVGYDGIVFANNKEGPTMALTRRDLFLALAKMVPDGNGGYIENTSKTWQDVRSDLPAIAIEVLGPPPTSGTRDAFVELAMEGGAKTFPDLAALRNEDKKKFKAIAHAIREDGAFIEAGENDNLIVQKLKANDKAFGIFGFSFLDNNTDSIKGATIDGVAPTFELIAAQEYPVSRPLFIYFKKQHAGAIPGLAEFIAEYTSEAAMGAEGYLSEKGLIPLPTEEFEAVQKSAHF